MLPLNNQSPATVAPQLSGTAQMQRKVSPMAKAMEFITLFASRWYWFVLCVALGLAGSYLYLKTTAPIYTRTASIKIKNDAKEVQSQMSFISSGVDLTDEMYTLKSRDFAATAVKNLRLDVACYGVGRFHEEIVYGSNLPVKILPLQLNDQEAADFMFELKGDGTYVMSDFTRNGEPVSGTVKGKVGKVAKTPIGNVDVQKVDNNAQMELSVRVDRQPLQIAIAKVMSNLSVSAMGDQSSIINITYMDESPQRAEDVISALLAVYDDSWMVDCNRKTVAASEFIKERLSVIEKELGSVEEDISSYKSANLIPSGANDVSSMYIEQVSSATQQATELNSQLYMARYVRNYLTNSANKYTLIPANQTFDNANLGSQISEYNNLLLARNNMLNVTSEQNPLVQRKDQQLDGLRSALIASIDNYIATLNVSLRAAQSVRGAANQKIASAPAQSQYLLSVERQQKVKENLYLYLLQKREENELSQAFTAYNTRMISSPTGSNIPTFPIPQMVWIIGFVAGLAVPAALIFLLEAMNNKVRTRKDLAELTIPFIGEVPLYRHHRTFSEKLFEPWKKMWTNIHNMLSPLEDFVEDKTLHILVKDHSRNVVNEAFRVIRTNIEFMTAKGGRGRVIMSTSFMPNSGKTFVVTNLITSFAIKKQKVLAIDLDLRKASLSAMVGKPKIGIADYLSGVTDSFDDVVIRNATHQYLDVVPVGTIPPNPTELLFDDRLKELLDELRDEYAYIILDCPPAEIIADASIIGKYSDATLFVIRAEHMDKSLLPDIQAYYEEDKLPKMSLILNGTADALSYYGYHRYGTYGGYARDDE